MAAMDAAAITNHSDELLRKLGKHSRWQIRTYVMLSIGFSVPYAWMLLGIIFIGDTPNHRCALPPNATLNETIPQICDAKGNCEYSKCEMYKYYNDSMGDNTTVSCTHGYWYDPASGYESTLATEWDLVCDKSNLIEISMTINAVGNAIGALFFNRLGDIYGRKTIFLISLYSNVVIAIAQAFSVNFWMYTILGFLDGLQQQGAVAQSFILALELYPTEQRTFAGNAIEFFFAFGYISLVCIAYFVRNWRHLQLCISVPLLATVVFYWYVPESIPWLLANGRYDEVEKIMKNAAKVSNVTLEEPILPEELKPLKDKETEANDKRPVRKSLRNCWGLLPTRSNEEPEADYGIIDLLKNRTLRLFAFLMIIIWFTNNVAYYALNLTVTYLPGNRYLNTLLFSLMEVPAYAAIWILMEKVGRIYPLMAFHIIGGLALILTVVQTLDVGVNFEVMVIVCSVIGKFCLTATFAGIYVQAPEVFPTNLRSIGLGVGQFFARIGSFISPYTRTLARSVPWVSPLCLGTLAIIAGGCIWFFPETRHHELPETIEEIEGWMKSGRHKRPEKGRYEHPEKSRPV